GLGGGKLREAAFEGRCNVLMQMLAALAQLCLVCSVLNECMLEGVYSVRRSPLTKHQLGRLKFVEALFKARLRQVGHRAQDLVGKSTTQRGGNRRDLSPSL